MADQNPSQPLEDEKCPRCQVNPAYPLGDNLGALSRATRDGGAGVTVCPECGEREALSGVVPIDEWPLSIDALLAEDRVRYEWHRESTIETIDSDDPDVDEGA
jgi:hypothetical protein